MSIELAIHNIGWIAWAHCFHSWKVKLNGRGRHSIFPTTNKNNIVNVWCACVKEFNSFMFRYLLFFLCPCLMVVALCDYVMCDACSLWMKSFTFYLSSFVCFVFGFDSPWLYRWRCKNTFIHPYVNELFIAAYLDKQRNRYLFYCKWIYSVLAFHSKR